MRDNEASRERTVLIVEDDEIFRNVMVKTLGDAGLVCEEAATGGEAIARALDVPDVLLLLDEQLPDMPGRAVISALAAQGKQAPFIVVTGRGDERLAVEMMKAGAADYLVKDAAVLERLPTVVKRVLRELESARMLRRAEIALMESERRFSGLFHEIEAVAILGCGEDGAIMHWNSAATRLYGYDECEAIGRDIWALLLPRDLHACMRIAVRNMIATGAPMPTTEMRLLRKKGEPVVVLMSYALVRLPDGGVEWFMMGVDLTARKSIEAERERLRNQLSKAQKMEAIGRLADGVTHDLNNMLGVISGYTELCLLQSPEDAAGRELLEEIRKAAARVADITRQLLAFSRKQEGAPRILDLNHVVDNMLKMLQRLVGAGIELVFEPDPDAGRVCMDPSHVEQILANLCVNASDAIGDTGRITLTTRMADIAADALTYEQDAKPGSYVVLSVRDTGCGLSDEARMNLFEPFYTTKPSGAGWGLGLAAVYGLTRQGGGFITVESTPGQGTVFHVHLPRVRIAVGRADDDADDDMASYSGTTATRGTILLVDDESAVLDLVRIPLEQEGYTVLIASSPRQAIALMEQHTKALDLLITDVVMPEMNGCALAEAVRKRHPRTRCLYMSGYSPDMVASLVGGCEGDELLQKPFPLSTLIIRVREMLGGDEIVAE